nr:hypothetical protein Iba_chr14dCG0910 [Ipomoea batatas]
MGGCGEDAGERRRCSFRWWFTTVAVAVSEREEETTVETAVGGIDGVPHVDEPRPAACHCRRRPTVVTSLVSSHKEVVHLVEVRAIRVCYAQSHGSDGRAMALRFLTKRAV